MSEEPGRGRSLLLCAAVVGIRSRSKGPQRGCMAASTCMPHVNLLWPTNERPPTSGVVEVCCVDSRTPQGCEEALKRHIRPDACCKQDWEGSETFYMSRGM